MTDTVTAPVTAPVPPPTDSIKKKLSDKFEKADFVGVPIDDGDVIIRLENKFYRVLWNYDKGKVKKYYEVFPVQTKVTLYLKRKEIND